MTRYSFALLFLLMLPGCTKRQEEAPAAQNAPLRNPARESTPAEAPPPPKLDDRPKIVAYGDSLTAGYQADPGKSYPDYLQKLLDEQGYRFQVINCGISGDTTSGGVARVDQVLSFKPKLVILELGGNDGLRGISVSLTRQNLEQIIQRLQQSGATVALAGITLPPNYGPDYIRSFEQNYAALSKQYKLRLLPFLLENVYGVPGMMQGDGIHATAEGNAIVAKNVFQLIQPLLKPLQKSNNTD